MEDERHGGRAMRRIHQIADRLGNVIAGQRYRRRPPRPTDARPGSSPVLDASDRTPPRLPFAARETPPRRTGWPRTRRSTRRAPPRRGGRMPQARASLGPPGSRARPSARSARNGERIPSRAVFRTTRRRDSAADIRARRESPRDRRPTRGVVYCREVRVTWNWSRHSRTLSSGRNSVK